MGCAEGGICGSKQWGGMPCLDESPPQAKKILKLHRPMNKIKN